MNVEVEQAVGPGNFLFQKNIKNSVIDFSDMVFVV